MKRLTSSTTAVLLLAGCSHHPGYHERLNEEVLSPPRPDLAYPVTKLITLPVHGLAINFEALPGWGRRTYQGVSVTFGKAREPVNLHTTLLVIDLLKVSPDTFESDAAFAAHFNAELQPLREAMGRDITFEVSPDHTKAPRCVAFKQVTESTERGTQLRFSRMAYICEHPSRPRTFVKIDYSESHKASMDNAEFWQRAMQTLAHVTFIDA